MGIRSDRRVDRHVNRHVGRHADAEGMWKYVDLRVNRLVKTDVDRNLDGRADKHVDGHVVNVCVEAEQRVVKSPAQVYMHRCTDIDICMHM